MNIDNIYLGKVSHDSGHEVYAFARQIDTDKQIIVKKNKFNKSQFSLFEVALTDISKLFLAPGLSANAQLLLRDDKVLGLAVDHIAYSALTREGEDASFYNIDSDGSVQWCERGADLPPVYFLNQFPHGYFATLCQNEKEAKIRIDWTALASVLCSAYTLEEDDLHKGNLGFYVVADEDKPRVVFFSIDHDLKLSGSIMSYYCPRPQHFHNASGPYQVTARDLLDFPCIQDSNNYYWPTRWRFWLNFFESKVYLNGPELRAFADLSKREAFKTAKWKAFYKHVLLTPSQLRLAYQNSFDNNNPKEQAVIDLFTDAIVERQAQMRAVLFSLPEFRHSIASFTDRDILDILEDIAPQDLTLRHSVYQRIEKERSLLSEFTDTDTPLHAAIRLGDYRYQSTWTNFGRFAAVVNEKNETALDICVKKALSPQVKSSQDIREDARASARHLYNLGAGCSAKNRLLLDDPALGLKNYLYHSPYVTQAAEAKTLNGIVAVLARIGQEDSYCLKLKKQVAVIAIKNFMAAQKRCSKQERLSTRQLHQLYKAVNGEGDPALREPLLYIRQLRSRYWIVQKIRGWLGGTSTQVRMSAIISKDLPNCGFSNNRWQFFNIFEKNEDEDKKPQPRV